MRRLVLASMLAIGFAFTACGGPPKPPMVPDDSSLGDGGSDTPTTTAPAPVSPPKVK
jgi:hypothetical protein